MRVLFSLIFILAACGYKVESGLIIAKEFFPAHFETYQSYEYVGQECEWDTEYYYDSEGDRHTRSEYNCESDYDYVPRQRWVPDTWSVLVQDCGDKVSETEYRCHQKWIEVTETYYSDVKINASWYGPRPS